ncbi:MAG: hypothetical protein IJ904_05340, partial [Candidatus Methanomethylophilaceae archaeon]|nr:hypothetical protein [Candidatus Methanomethylophilaceae archaeon]
MRLRHSPDGVLPRGELLLHSVPQGQGEEVQPGTGLRAGREHQAGRHQEVRLRPEALAENNVVHGDIKHSNVFVVKASRGYEPRFIDFDDSYFSGEPPEPESTIGSPEFYSPELGKYIMSDDPDLKGTVQCKSDVFASAIMFHDYYTGKRMLQRHGKYPFLIDSSKDMIMAIPSGQLKELIKSMMEVETSRRADASTVLETMKAICGEAP